MLGLTVGIGVTAAVVIAGLYSMRRRDNGPSEEEDFKAKDAHKEREESLEQKIRKAEYEASRNVERCKHEITDYCQRQLQVLEEVCKPSHIELKSKTLFFLHYHPLTKQRIYFYERDIIEEQEVLVNKAKEIARGYDQHIQLFLTKLQVFEELYANHVENLARLKGMQHQNAKFNRLHRHQEHLERMDAGENEQGLSQRYQQKGFLEEIEEALQSHEAVLQQYLLLAERYKGRENKQLEAAFQKDLQNLLRNMPKGKVSLPERRDDSKQRD